MAAQRTADEQGREWLQTVPIKESEDEFLSGLETPETSEADEAEEGKEETPQIFETACEEILVAPESSLRGTLQDIDPNSGLICDAAKPGTTRYRLQINMACPHCGATFSRSGDRLLSIRFGAPFLLGSIIPELLDDASPASIPIQDGKPDNRLRPADGRQLLMFTDSRQGTARLAAKLQSDVERNHIRAFIYHNVQASSPSGDPEKRAKLESDIAALRLAFQSHPSIEGVLLNHERELASLDKPQPIDWAKMVDRISGDDRIDRFIRERVWTAREPEFHNRPKFAKFLLLREFVRQPFRANSVETMGLASLRFKHIEDIQEHQLSPSFVRHGGVLNDWREFLYIAMTRLARQNWCVDVDREVMHWISHKATTKSIKPPGQEFDRMREVGWPGQSKPSERRLLVRLLAQGLGLSLENRGDRDDIDECLARAWQHFQGICQQTEVGFKLDFERASLMPVTEAYICPVVKSIVRDRTFRGLSPNPPTPQSEFLKAEKVALPVLPFPYHQEEGRPVEVSRVTTWLNEDAIVQRLRRLGIWSNIHDRAAKYSVYFRSAEHSAQQPAERLRQYEREFKAGRINVLSCSTTMEMGVDIGSISTVVMSNVPPSIASYRQRVGRAGRRGQSTSLSLTLCKDRPLDRSTFRNPQSFLRRTIYAPSVALDSVVIVQRHVNATMLARFLRIREVQLHKIPVGPFFGFERDGKTKAPGTSLGEEFAAWLDRESLRTAPDLVGELKLLLAGTALDGDIDAAIDETREAIVQVRIDFSNEWDAIRFDFVDTREDTPRSRALELQIRRLTGEFLLGDLAGRGFLPAYGFPTDVVNFDTDTFFKSDPARPQGEVKQKDGANQRFRLRDTPSRQLDLAIRDYAPGNDVVVDGRVYRSAGLRLDWKRPVTEENSRQIQTLGTAWSCRTCGALGTGHADPNACSSCGGTNLLNHRYLKPAGFSCDPLEKPHDKVEEVNFIRPRAPWVAASGGEWVHLTAREAGRHRASRSGAVFHHTLGAEGYGYAICLACGRTEPEFRPRHEMPPLPRGMAVHRPLRSKRGAEWCDGSENGNSAFMIQRHRALGYEVTTDVFDLQLFGIQSASVALPLAAALRDALARKLGVEDAEMGISASETKAEDGVGRWSVLIYDKAPGGAGFSISAGIHIEDLLKDAAEILDCPNGANCTKGCPECVMCRDLEAHEQIIHRIEAFRFIRELVQQLGLPQDLAVFGPETRPESQPLVDAIMREMERDHEAELRINLFGQPGDWDLARWPVLRAAHRLASRGRCVRIVMDSSVPAKLDHASRIELYGLVIKAGCNLDIGATAQTIADHAVLASVGLGADRIAWATRDARAIQANDTWSRVRQGNHRARHLDGWRRAGQSNRSKQVLRGDGAHCAVFVDHRTEWKN